MASGQHADALKLTPEELRRSGEQELPGAPIVHVEGYEEQNPKSPRSPRSPSRHSEGGLDQKPVVTHETQTVKTTVAEEEDRPPHSSMRDKVKGKVQHIGDKLRPQNAVHAKEEDPHPSVV